MSSRMASKTTLNWVSYFLSSSSNRRAKSRWLKMISRNLAKARMICMLTWMALGLLKTLESMATPCSVKTVTALENFRVSCLAEDVTNCDTLLISFRVR